MHPVIVKPIDILLGYRDPLLNPIVVIGISNNILFRKCFAGLNLDNFDRFFTGASYTMLDTSFDKDVITVRKILGLIVESNPGRTLNHYPVLIPKLVTLQTQPLSRFHNQAFYLSIRLVGQYIERAPGPVFMINAFRHYSHLLLGISQSYYRFSSKRGLSRP